MRVIEKAKVKDKDAILKLYKSQLGRQYCPWNEYYPTMEEIDFDLSRDALLVMREDGKIIAAISIDDDDSVNNLDCWTDELQPGGELSRLAVDPEFQNQGIAKEMINYGMKALKERDFKSLHFLVNRHNLKAMKSYAAFGFNKVGECELYDQPMFCYEMKL
jgi:ribosomal protein S18 acetylase RimI-like enzyme